MRKIIFACTIALLAGFTTLPAQACDSCNHDNDRVEVRPENPSASDDAMNVSYESESACDTCSAPRVETCDTCAPVCDYCEPREEDKWRASGEGYGAWGGYK